MCVLITDACWTIILNMKANQMACLLFVLWRFGMCSSTLYVASLTLCILETPKRILCNSEDPVEMQHHAAFHQDLHCLLRSNILQRRTS